MKVGMALLCFVVGKATSFSCTNDQIELAITIKDGTTGSCTEYVLEIHLPCCHSMNLHAHSPVAVLM